MAFPTIPTAVSGDLLSSTTSPASTTHTFPNLSSLRGGAGPQAGDLLIAIIVQYQGGTAGAEFGTWGASFTETLDDALASGTGNEALGVARKIAAGTESGTFTVTSAHSFKSVQFLMRIPAATWHGTTIPEVLAAVRAAGAVADPGSFDPTNWAAEDTLWIAIAGQTETSTTGSPPTLDSPPTNFTGQLIVARVADAVGDITAGVAFRQENASAQDVGTWTASNANRGNGIASVIAIRPLFVQVDTPTIQGAVAGGPSPTPVTVLVLQGAVGQGLVFAPIVAPTIQGAVAGGFAPTEGISSGDTATPGGAVADGVSPTADASVSAGGAVADGVAPSTSSNLVSGGALAGGQDSTSTVSLAQGGALAGGVTSAAWTMSVIAGALAGGFAPVEQLSGGDLVPIGGSTAAGLSPSPAATSTTGGALVGGIDVSGISVQLTIDGALAGGRAPFSLGGTVIYLDPIPVPEISSYVTIGQAQRGGG